MPAEPRLVDVARERLDAQRAEALRRVRDAMDRAAEDFAPLLALELPEPVRQGVVDVLRKTAGLEALAEALADGTVHEGRS